MIIAVCSSMVGEGATVVATNTAVAAGRAGLRTALVDADFETQGAARLMSTVPHESRSVGLADVVRDEVGLEDAIVEIDVGAGGVVGLLTRGHGDVAVPELLGSQATGRVLAQLADLYDVVIIDLPPLLQVAYATSIVRKADYALVVVRHESSVDNLRDLRDRLDLIEVDTLGYVYSDAPGDLDALGLVYSNAPSDLDPSGDLDAESEGGLDRDDEPDGDVNLETTVRSATTVGESDSAGHTPASAGEPAGDELRSWRSATGGWLLVSAVALWLSSLRDVDLRAMTEVGLLSVLPSTFFVALALLTLGFIFVVEHRPDRHRIVAGYLVTLSAMVHATPAILYGTVRYSWSWKHLGIVDYIQRTGSVDPDAAFLAIYHGWPGVFSAAAWLSEIGGIDPRTIAMWTPFALSLLSLAALSVVFRLFVADRRTVAIALWVFVLANWVGQDYFSPQGITYVMYLGLIALALPLERSESAGVGGFVLQPDVGFSSASHRGRLLLRLLTVSIVVAIVASHQLTPIMIVVTFAIVAATRIARTAWIAVAAIAATLAWVSGPALTYVRENGLNATDALGSPASTSGESVLDTARVSAGQAIVVIADRFLAEALLVLAVVGLVVLWRRGNGVVVMGLLLVAPVALLVTDFGGEMLFRSYLFATPWIALCGAVGLVAVTAARSPNVRIGLRALVSTVLLVAFLFAYLGKERTNYFTPDEIEVATWLYENAPPNTLLIEGTPNYPGQFLNYENFFYVPISREPDSSIARMNADPEAQLYRWMTNDDYDASYFILTRGMYNEQRSISSVPDGLFERTDAALRESERFEIVRSNNDATIWIVVEEADS